MALVTVTVALLFAQAQFAPSDVPKSHWAYPPVNGLFQEGLLKGYPAESQPKLRLESGVKRDHAKAVNWKNRWQKQGLFTPYPNTFRPQRDPSDYELAIVVHSAWVGIQDILKVGSGSDLRQTAISEIGAIAEAISMFHFELTKLGLDTKEMIASLNDLQDSQHRRYLGDR